MSCPPLARPARLLPALAAATASRLRLTACGCRRGRRHLGSADGRGRHVVLPDPVRDAADHRRRVPVTGPDQAGRRAARPRAGAAGHRRHDQGAARRLRRRASSRRSTRPSAQVDAGQGPRRRRRGADLTSRLAEESAATRARPTRSTDAPRARRGSDPHFWLDPSALRRRRRGHRRAPGEGRPGQRGDLREERRGLRREARPRSTTSSASGLASCRTQGPRHQPRRLRLPRRSATGSTQHGITGISPEAEPSAPPSRPSPTSSRSTGSRRSTRRPSSSRTSPRRSPESRAPRSRRSTPSRASRRVRGPRLL